MNRFGFECQLAVPGGNGAIAHAQLTLDGGMIMLGSVSSEGEYGRLLAQPDEIGGREGHVWNVGTYDPWQAGRLFDKP